MTVNYKIQFEIYSDLNLPVVRNSVFKTSAVVIQVIQQALNSQDLTMKAMNVNVFS